MKLLFDQNLSRKLVPRLADIFPNSSHVMFQGLAEETDTTIWEFAKMNDFCIVTQDADFAERSRLYGSPPKVIWLRCGNTPTHIAFLTYSIKKCNTTAIFSDSPHPISYNIYR